MSLLEIFCTIFRARKAWIELDTLYSAERREGICSYLTDRGIPYKMRAAQLPMNGTVPIGALAMPMWYLSVHPGDVEKVSHYQRGEQ